MTQLISGRWGSLLPLLERSLAAIVSSGGIENTWIGIYKLAPEELY